MSDRLSQLLEEKTTTLVFQVRESSYTECICSMNTCLLISHQGALISLSDMHSVPFGQFHIKFDQFQFDQFHFYLLPFTISRYSSAYMEYLLQVVYIPNRIVMEEIFLN